MSGIYGIPFDQFIVGGNLQATDIVVGLRGGLNTQFSAASAIFAWTPIAVNTVLVGNNGYYTTGGGVLLLTLPATCPAGDVIRIAGFESTGWKLVQNSGQQVTLGDLITTSGALGYLQSTNAGDCIELLCVTANVNFVVLSSMGNITIV